MKKQLLSIAFVIATANMFAQITLTSADIQTAFNIVYQSTDTTPTISIGNGGANQTWDFSDLLLQTRDTLTFLPSSAQPNPRFPSANLLVKQGWQNNYAYLYSSSTEFSSLGNAGQADFGTGPVFINQVNTPSEKLLNLPVSFGNSFTNNYKTNVKTFLGQMIQGLQIDSIRFKSTISKTQTIDGWGALTTPLGVYNVLRIKETKVSIKFLYFLLI